MRAAGEISRAIVQAAFDLTQVVDGQRRGATLKELAERAQVGLTAARFTVQNLTRAGALEKVAQREVDYRTRPVHEYAPKALADNEEGAAAADELGRAFALWVQRQSRTGSIQRGEPRI